MESSIRFIQTMCIIFKNCWLCTHSGITWNQLNPCISISHNLNIWYSFSIVYSSFSKIQQYQYYTKPWYSNIILYLWYSPSLIQALCMHHQTWRKRRSSLNFARIEKCQKRRWHYFSILSGVCFLTFFDTGKTQRARPFPSFSHEPHANQDHMAPSKVLGKLGSLLHPPRNATGQSKVCVLSIFSQERALYVCALTIGVLAPPP